MPCVMPALPAHDKPPRESDPSLSDVRLSFTTANVAVFIYDLFEMICIIGYFLQLEIHSPLPLYLNPARRLIIEHIRKEEGCTTG